MVDFNDVLVAASQLSRHDQDRLIDALRCGSLSDTDELSDEWKAEIERRVARLKAGGVKTIPWEEVHANARKRAGL